MKERDVLIGKTESEHSGVQGSIEYRWRHRDAVLIAIGLRKLRRIGLYETFKESLISNTVVERKKDEPANW